MSKTTIETYAAPSAIGTYSQAERAGDTEAMYELSQCFAALADVPGYEPETDPEYNALSEALDGDSDEALAAVLDTLGDLNRYLGKYQQTPLGMALSALGRSAARVRMFLDRGARALRERRAT